VTDAPELEVTEAPAPDTVRTARQVRPVKLDADAAYEREKKRRQRAKAKATREAAEPPPAASPPPVTPEIAGRETSPEEAAALMRALMLGAAKFTGRPALELTDDEAAALGEAFAPLVNKYGAELVGRWVVELNALSAAVLILGPKFMAAFWAPPAPRAVPPIKSIAPDATATA
jgi:hypothetical protein